MFDSGIFPTKLDSFFPFSFILGVTRHPCGLLVLPQNAKIGIFKTTRRTGGFDLIKL